MIGGAMRKILFWAMCALLFTAQSFAAAPEPGTESYSYYVDVNSTGASAPYGSWATAAVNIDTVLSYIIANRATGDTKCIYVAPGIGGDVNARIRFLDVEVSNTTSTGALGASAQDASESVRDSVIFQVPAASNQHGVISDADADGLMLLNLTIAVEAAGRYALNIVESDGFTARNIVIKGVAPQSSHLSYFNGVNNLYLSRVIGRVTAAATAYNYIELAGATNGTISFCSFSSPSIAYRGVNTNSTGTVNIYNSVFFDYNFKK